MTGCGDREAAPPTPEPEPELGPVTITLVGTNDLHGHIRALPILGGYLRVLRELREEDGGVVLLDGGDMFQGTLESNLAEGAPVIRAYSALGYDAATIGNHEFDYGPVGPAATVRNETVRNETVRNETVRNETVRNETVRNETDGRRGALLARASEAEFPMLNANLQVAATHASIEWPNVTPVARFERGGLSIGVIGVTTESTLRTTIHANIEDLSIEPLAVAIAREAAALREDGVQLVFVAAHAGGKCTEHDDPHDTSSCETDQEIHSVVEALPNGAVDAIVAGHTHQAMSHFVGGVPIIESYSYGRAFGRIDLTYDRASNRVTEVTVHPPRDLCESGGADDGDCVLGDYEGETVTADPAITRLVAPSIASAREARERALGVVLLGDVSRTRVAECALGNLVTDLMLAARENNDVAMTNGGGLRADLPRGPLTYGSFYEAFPFDNRFAIVEMTGADLRLVIAENLRRSGSFFSFAGARAEARCAGDELVVRIRRDNGRPIRDDEPIRMVTTDFLATGGDGALGAVTARDGAVTIEDGDPVREVLISEIAERDEPIDPSALYDPDHPRIRYEGVRPLHCP